MAVINEIIATVVLQCLRSKTCLCNSVLGCLWLQTVNVLDVFENFSKYWLREAWI